MNLTEINIREKKFHDILESSESPRFEKIFYKALFNLRKYFIEYLKKNIFEKEVLYFGCGTGAMSQDLYQYKPKKTLGIVGFGKIGREVHRRCKSFQMNILEYIDIFVASDIDYEYCIESINDCGNSDWNCDVGSLSIGDIGDVNLDQTIDILDVINVLNFVLEQTVPTETEFWLSDINSDGVLNILDLVQLVNIILG